MFTEKSFQVFKINGLEARMAAIRREIQPIFQEVGEQLREQLSPSLPEQDFYLHIAQHRRRTRFAPESTLCAISTNKRGYKMEPHIQLGICEDYVWLYLSLLEQPVGQKKFAEILAMEDFPTEFVLSKDHMTTEFFQLTELKAAVSRLMTIKKSEFEIGRIWPKVFFSKSKEKEILTDFSKTLDDLLPIYKKLLMVSQTERSQ